MTNEEHEEDEEVISCVVDEAVSQIGPTDEVMIKNRAYPIFCAVCLSEYEISDRVCRLSSSECSNLFHEHFIFQLLVALKERNSPRSKLSPRIQVKRSCSISMSCPWL